ncbi:RluA family pseudouridine synthase [Candidatus Peregrinibacteria bacterium]|nr:RluA family pseudouridine synthase [Candidatus Peregrinibacteria bacterium]
MRHYTVSPEDKGMRLDQYLAKDKPEYTRSFLQKIIKGGSVFINDKKVTKAALRVNEGDELVVIVPSIRETGIHAEDIPLDIVYEDKDIVVVNKPAGMPVHPTDHGAHVSGTLVNALLYHCKNSLSGIGGEMRPGIVHRLDKQTSGLLISAKNDHAHRMVSGQIMARHITKRYITLLKGHLTPKTGSIEAPILKTLGEKKVQISNHEKAKYALTHYQVIKYLGNYSLVEVRIVTGRTHQIRVHFASIGHPVAGDDHYGDPLDNETLKQKTGLSRQFLHAAYLKFKLPSNGQEIELEAPMPKDLKMTLKKLEK